MTTVDESAQLIKYFRDQKSAPSCSIGTYLETNYQLEWKWNVVTSNGCQITEQPILEYAPARGSRLRSFNGTSLVRTAHSACKRFSGHAREPVERHQTRSEDSQRYGRFRVDPGETRLTVP